MTIDQLKTQVDLAERHYAGECMAVSQAEYRRENARRLLVAAQERLLAALKAKPA
jgi:hypothetical protein